MTNKQREKIYSRINEAMVSDNTRRLAWDLFTEYLIFETEGGNMSVFWDMDNDMIMFSNSELLISIGGK